MPTSPEQPSRPLSFRVDWGYQFLYSRRQYHPVYRWDGELTCTGGTVRKVFQLKYPYSWWGVPHTAEETLLPAPQWRSETRRSLAGIRVEAECGPDAQFTLDTAQGTLRFSASDILNEGRIVFPVGWKYSHCTVIVTRDGYEWFRNPAKAGEVVVGPHDLEGAEAISFSRSPQAWIEPGSGASFDVTLPTPDPSVEDAPPDERLWLFHLEGMTARKKDDPEALARDFMPMQLRTDDGKVLFDHRQFLRYHDNSIQIMHDVQREIPLSALEPGRRRLTLANLHLQLPLLVRRISLRPIVRRHLEVQAPRWALTGKPFSVRVRTLRASSRIRLEYDAGSLRCDNEPAPSDSFPPGLHEFRFTALVPRLNVPVKAVDLDTGADGAAAVKAVYAMATEAPEVKVGYDMTTVPHDDTGVMDRLLDYTHRTQLGNLVCFRPFPMGTGVADGLLERWGSYCREHNIYVQGINLDAGPLPSASGEYFDGIGNHELSGAVYFKDPDNRSLSMKIAAERYVEFVREHVNRIRASAPRVAFGDASGGHRYSLLAGADFLRAETMVPHSMQHLSQARAASQALGSGEWGVHIAIQHAKQPYLESHLSQYHLSLYQAWMMGAAFIYEEDSLFVMFKEERQCWDDRLTRGKRDMTRDFFRFVSTHPRPGAGPQIAVAVLLGRYAAPFNGFICGTDQDPTYSVWGQFGRTEPAWGHLQPEKGQQLADVLMPGASTHPLRQRYDRCRFYFSGTPYGDFDQAPIEAESSFLSRYRLLMLLGWNTMTPEDYRKLLDFVEAGGTLLFGVPQLSTHEGRDFLTAMDDLALYADGDLTALCGVRVKGRGVRYSGHWTPTGPDFRDAACPPLSRVPSAAPDEDGPCHLAAVELAGAEPVIVDAASGQPLLVRNRVGRGQVLLITTEAYPGHEELADFAGAVISRVCEEHIGPVRVADPSGEVFWTWWPDRLAGCGQLMLLNTDWTTQGNEKRVAVHTPAVSFPVAVRDREACLVTCFPFGALTQSNPEPFVEITGLDAGQVRLRIHGTGAQSFRLHPAADVDIWASEAVETHCVVTTSDGFEIRFRESSVVELSLTRQ